MTPEFVDQVLSAWALVRAEQILNGTCRRSGCPRRPAHGTPACYRHLDKQEREAAKVMRQGARTFVDRWLPALWPACWFWPVPTEGNFSTPKAIYQWQDGQCAICAEPWDMGGHWGMVLDHDHKTGLIRDWLCRICNAAEGHSTIDGRRLNYRNRPPVAMLGVRRPYNKRESRAKHAPGPQQLALDDLL
ncbi:endonuclease domain-containing protein [Nocardia asteroides]|uniref:endonuclease domain-containing protein n=1 Tax=Nocardia asteroides TaxID=1824 RepID=UPI001E59A0AF|nr:endonuclease domain-containing protein [Nocardia asteroides]UGT58880.1 endonuclease VII domain-containing protein [Nocardia asteroides]